MNEHKEPAVQVGDTVVMKKSHACGGDYWLVTRTGMDFGLRCVACGRNIMLPRRDFFRNLVCIAEKQGGQA